MVKTAIAESRDWRKAIDDRLLAYRTTPHSVTEKPPALMMFGRNVNDKLPSHQPSASVKINRKSYREQDAKYKLKSKRYRDTKKKIRTHSIKLGEHALIRSEKKGKVVLPWHRTTFRVNAVKGDSLIVEGGNHRLMRHSTAVKKVPAITTKAHPASPPATSTQERTRRLNQRQPE